MEGFTATGEEVMEAVRASKGYTDEGDASGASAADA
ncbi:hypothetical protein JOF55_002772 [Haloactinomyces albus]|uniref:Uncharacterized protein n=1 Tax=Haloactinomyces albus TaxID=1352928 RepID=A0AAE4CMN0_9ACTN|nr:hypothetical protein [Haloactinomyces albus]